MIFGEWTKGVLVIAGLSGLSWWQTLVLGLLGLSAGGVVAAGVFAFLAIIGVFPRLMGRTKTKHIVLGGILGNVSDIYELPIHLGGNLTLGIFGMTSGIFVGCLVMSLAETLKALPVISRRIGMAVGLQYVILAVALGKLAGSLVYFVKGLCM